MIHLLTWTKMPQIQKIVRIAVKLVTLCPGKKEVKSAGPMEFVRRSET